MSLVCCVVVQERSQRTDTWVLRSIVAPITSHRMTVRMLGQSKGNTNADTISLLKRINNDTCSLILDWRYEKTQAQPDKIYISLTFAKIITEHVAHTLLRRLQQLSNSVCICFCIWPSDPDDEVASLASSSGNCGTRSSHRIPVKDWKTSPRGSPKLKRKTKKDDGYVW